MKSHKRWSVVPTTIAAVLALSGIASSQVVAIAPNSPEVTLNGNSGGVKKDSGCAGFVAETPNHTIKVTAASNLRFSLQGTGQPTLLIMGAKGQTVCVQADSMSNGKIEIPGRWSEGDYLVYVGDRAQVSNPYTLSITSR